MSNDLKFLKEALKKQEKGIISEPIDEMSHIGAHLQQYNDMGLKPTIEIDETKLSDPDLRKAVKDFYADNEGFYYNRNDFGDDTFKGINKSGLKRSIDSLIFLELVGEKYGYEAVMNMEKKWRDAKVLEYKSQLDNGQNLPYFDEPQLDSSPPWESPPPLKNHPRDEGGLLGGGPIIFDILKISIKSLSMSSLMYKAADALTFEDGVDFADPFRGYMKEFKGIELTKEMAVFTLQNVIQDMYASGTLPVRLANELKDGILTKQEFAEALSKQGLKDLKDYGLTTEDLFSPENIESHLNAKDFLDELSLEKTSNEVIQGLVAFELTQKIKLLQEFEELRPQENSPPPKRQREAKKIHQKIDPVSETRKGFRSTMNELDLTPKDAEPSASRDNKLNQTLNV